MPGIWVIESLGPSSSSVLRRLDHMRPTCTVSGDDCTSATAVPSGAWLARITTVNEP